MKPWTLIVIVLILLTSCHDKYFEYDNIDYYFNDFDGDKVIDLYDNKSRSDLDSLKLGVITGKIPNSVSDLSFIDKLETIGYRKESIDKSKFKSIDEIFVEKTVFSTSAYACIYVYRDILVFKRSDQVVGIAKVCFECGAHEIVGTVSDTKNFGQNGDYDRLFKIVRN